MLSLCLAACTSQNEIVDGIYEAHEVRGHESIDEMLILATSLDIDRSTATATFTLHDGSVISAGFSERPREDWPIGCPGKDTDMELLELDEATLTIVSLELVDPVLIASCPSGAPEVVLTEDGITHYGGVPCQGRCVTFVPVND